MEKVILEKLKKAGRPKKVEKQIMNKIAEFFKKQTEDITSSLKILEGNIEQRYNLQMNLTYNKFVNGIVQHKIVVEKENRDKGVGTQAMQALCSFADSKKLYF